MPPHSKIYLSLSVSALRPCQGKWPLRKYMYMWPSASKSSLRDCSLPWKKKIKKFCSSFLITPTYCWASGAHDGKGTFFIIFQCFSSFSTMRMRPLVEIHNSYHLGRKTLKIGYSLFCDILTGWKSLKSLIFFLQCVIFQGGGFFYQKSNTVALNRGELDWCYDNDLLGIGLSNTDLPGKKRLEFSS